MGIDYSGLLEQVLAHRLGDRGGPVTDSELLVDAPEVSLDRGCRQVEPAGHLR